MLEIFREQFFINSLVALVILSFVTGALGSFMVWQKFSYLGDSLSHSSLLGVALSIIFHVNTSVSIIFIAILFAILLSINLNKLYSVDAVLNIITNVILSLGLLLISMFPSANSNIIHSLFGDILMLSFNDLFLISIVSVIIILVFIYKWRDWLILSINQDLAISQGINVTVVRFEFLITLSIFIAISSQVIGILLITAFLIIPAAAARIITKTPFQMIIVATIVSLISGISGLLLSIQLDTLSGPSIIITSFVIMLIMYFSKYYIFKNI